MPAASTGRLVAAALVLIGAILLAAAIFTPWYSLDSTRGEVGTPSNPYNNGTYNATYYLGLPSANGTIWYSCSGDGFKCPSQTSYSSAGQNNTGIVAVISFGLLVAGCAFGAISGVLGILFRRNSTWAFPVIVFAVIALVLAIAAPGIFAASLPGAFSKDSPKGPCGGSAPGPWSSFYGSTSTNCGFGLISFSYSWGPLIGWYLSLVAFAILVVGVILLLLYRRNPPRPAPSPS
jgi:hypothetical protein